MARIGAKTLPHRPSSMPHHCWRLVRLSDHTRCTAARYRVDDHRALPDGRPVGLDQRISALDALRIYTVGSAHASGEAEFKGRLRPGHLADFVVLNTDILMAEPPTIAHTKVMSTWSVAASWPPE